METGVSVARICHYNITQYLMLFRGWRVRASKAGVCGDQRGWCFLHSSVSNTFQSIAVL